MTTATEEKTAAEIAEAPEPTNEVAKPEQPEPLTWADVNEGDEIEVYVLDMQFGWQWERRQVLAVDTAGGEGGEAPLLLTLRDPNEDREYELDGHADIARPLRWPEVPIEEEPDGQQRIGGPGTEPTFSTDAGGTPPHEAELSLKAKKIEWPTDLRRGSSVLLLVWAYVDEVRVGSGSKTFVADIGRHMLVEHPTLRPVEVMDALAALESRPQRDRAVIDQAAQLAAELIDGAGGIVDLDLAVAMRERLYERYHIDDDAHEATHGTPDHEEPEDEGAPNMTAENDEPELAAVAADATDGGGD